jgi:hypothetical protein
MRKNRRFRVKVAERPHRRNRRRALFAALFCVVCLGAAALAALRHVAGELGAPVSLVIKDALTPKLLALEVVGAPDDVRESAQQFLDSRPSLTPVAAAAALKDEFSFLETVVVRRDWFRRLARLEFGMRSCAAAATQRGKPAGYVSDEGVRFSAPEGLYRPEAPVIEAGTASVEDLKGAARIARAAREQDALPAAMLELRWGLGGWEARLADGTEILWGDGRWTADKLQRLREVLADAKSQPAAGRFTADLRYFEDGRVLLRPLPARAALR